MASLKRKGAILAGGTGTRLMPLTKLINKHLLPVYDRLMVTYPIETLKKTGVTNICIVTGAKDLSDFRRFVGDGSEYEVEIEYRTQTGPNGLADAVYKTANFFGGQKPIIVLGDDILTYVNFPIKALSDDNAYAAVTKAEGIGIDPRAVAVPEFTQSGDICRVTEKPSNPSSDFMVAGFYIFPNDVFDFIEELKPSSRGELEISDVTNWYAANGRLKPIYDLEFIADAGSLRSMLEASIWRSKIVSKGSGEA